MQPFNKYQNGKIYKVWSLETDEIYVGSTVDLLHKRMYKHRHDAKHGRTKMKIHQEMQRGEASFSIELIENYPCSNRDELHKREGYWIRELKASLNMRIAGRGDKEYYQEHREYKLKRQNAYRLAHLDEIAENSKVYRLKNSCRISQQRKEFREANKDRLRDVSRKYREQNKEKIQAHKSESRICTVCGSTYTNCHKTRHERTQKHLQALAKQTE